VIAMRRFSILLTALLTVFLGVPGTAQAATPLPSSVGSVGDSITRGFDATWLGCLLTDCPQYSWSTGSSSTVASHATRIRAAKGGTVATANTARTGAKMVELGDQLARLPEVGYVTVLMGANDVCTSSIATMTPVETFRTQFRNALTAFAQQRPTTTVFVSSIPNLYQLYTLLRGNRSATSAWRTFGICQSMLAATNTESQRQTVLAHERALNAVLQQECGLVVTCVFDGGATFNYAFRATDVSTVDYFHPSISGQASLANVTWTSAREVWGI
jgi:lysophospholipase L1-like esterase